MAGLLESLSMGLRSAGGIMDEGVYKGQRQEELIQWQLQEKRKDLMAQQVIRAAEMGAMPPEAAQQALAQIGYKGLPVGPDAQTQQRQEEIKRRDAISRSFSELAPEERSNPRRIAEVFMANGDHAQGAKYLEAAEARQARQEALIANLEQRRDAMEQRAQDATLNREQRADLARQANELRVTIAQGQQSLQREGLELRRIMGQQSAEIQRGNQQLRLDQRERTLSDRDDQTVERQITATSNRMKDIQPVATAAKQLNDILAQYTPDTVPGLGYLKNTNLGAVALSDEGKNVSSSVKLVGNSILKAMSGAAVTPSEEVRQMAAGMADGRFSAKDFYVAWPKIAAWINDQQSLAAAPLAPAARERFQERTNIRLDPITPRFIFENGRLKDTKGNTVPASSVRSQADAILAR